MQTNAAAATRTRKSTTHFVPSRYPSPLTLTCRPRLSTYGVPAKVLILEVTLNTLFGIIEALITPHPVFPPPKHLRTNTNNNHRGETRPQVAWASPLEPSSPPSPSSAPPRRSSPGSPSCAPFAQPTPALSAASTPRRGGGGAASARRVTLAMRRSSSDQAPRKTADRSQVRL